LARNTKGGLIIAAWPSGYRSSQAPKDIKLRKKFTAAVRLSQYIVSLPSLKAIWSKYAGPDQRAYLAIMKNNYGYIEYDKPTQKNIITPGGFTLPAVDASVESSRIIISISAFSKVPGLSAKIKDLSLNAVVIFTDPVKTKEGPFRVMAFSKEAENYNFNEAGSFQFDFDRAQKNISSKYTKRILFLSAACKNGKGKIIIYSSTYSKVS